MVEETPQVRCNPAASNCIDCSGGASWMAPRPLYPNQPINQSMDLALYLIAAIGGLLCLLSLAQLGFWAAQSWQFQTHNRKQFNLARELMRRQIESAHQLRQQGILDAPAQTDAVDELSQAQVESESRDVSVDADGRWRGFREFTIVQAQDEAQGCRTLKLQPVDGLPIADFVPGQHLPIRLSIPGQSKPVTRCYSLSNGPAQGLYRLTVKAVPPPAGQPQMAPGIASNFIQSLQAGDQILARAPAGKFLLDCESKRPIVMLAGGIGITPMTSIIEHQLDQQSKRLMVLVYGVRNGLEQPFKQWLDQQAAAHSNLIVVHCYSQPLAKELQGRDYQVPGRVSVELLKQILPDNQCDYYLCGPPAFMESLDTGLQEWGVPDALIRSEAFGPAARPTRKPAANPLTARISFSKSGQTADWSAECESLLDLAEQAGVEIESSCRSGSCGTCAVHLLAGQVQYSDDIDADCDSDQCLPCVAVPHSSCQEIKLDA